MKKMTKVQMLEKVMEARNNELTPSDLLNAVKYVNKKPLAYVKKVYDLFLLDKEHAIFYYALLVR